MKNRIVTIVSMIFLAVLSLGGWKYRVGRTEFSIGSRGDFDKGELSDGIWL